MIPRVPYITADLFCIKDVFAGFSTRKLPGHEINGFCWKRREFQIFQVQESIFREQEIWKTWPETLIDFSPYPRNPNTLSEVRQFSPTNIAKKYLEQLRYGIRLDVLRRTYIFVATPLTTKRSQWPVET